MEKEQIQGQLDIEGDVVDKKQIIVATHDYDLIENPMNNVKSSTNPSKKKNTMFYLSILFIIALFVVVTWAIVFTVLYVYKHDRKSSSNTNSNCKSPYPFNDKQNPVKIAMIMQSVYSNYFI